MKNFNLIVILVSAVLLLQACSLSQSVDSIGATSASNEVTYARYVPERKDDFAWENDLVAFRMYGPAARSGAENSGLDCWLKRVKTPIVDNWYKQALEQGKSYHKDWGEGLDNYHVGSSAGCGSLALWLDGKREPLETWVDWKILEKTPKKTTFSLSYEHDINGTVYKELKEVEIETGQRLFKATSTFWVNDKLAIGLPISVGISTHDEKASTYLNEEAGIVSAWEVIGDYGLGIGVLVDPSKLQQVVVVPSLGIKDEGHALAVVNTDHDGQVVYYAGYGWQKANEITTFSQWQNYMLMFSENSVELK